MSTPSTQSQLRAVGLFEDLGVKDLEALAAMATLVKAQPRELIVEESARGSDVFTILEGRVSINILMPGRGAQTETIADLRDGDTFGESVLLGRQRRIASAEAQTEVTALRWEVEQLNGYFAKNPACGYLVMRNLARILQGRLSSTNMMLRNTFNRIVDIL